MYPNAKHMVIGNKIHLTNVRASIYRSLSAVMQTPTGWHLLVARGNGRAYLGGSHSSLQQVDKPTAGAQEDGSIHNSLESRPLPAGTGVGDVFHEDMCNGCDGLLHGHGHQQAPAGLRHGGQTSHTFLSLPLSLPIVSWDKGLVEDSPSTWLTQSDSGPVIL